LTRTAAGLALAGCVAVAGAGAALVVARHIHDHHADGVQHAQMAVQSIVDTRFARLTSRVNQYARVLPRSTSDQLRLLAAPRSDFTSVAVARPGLPLSLRNGDTAGLQRLRPAIMSTAVRAAAATARDSGQPIATVTSTSGAPQLVVTWPLYAGQIPPDTQTRRSSSAGWVVGSTRVTDVTAPVVAVAHLFGTHARLVTAPAGPANVNAVLADGVRLQADSVPRESWLPFWLIVAVTALATAALGTVTVFARRREHADRRRRQALDRQIHLVSELSVTAQESLDTAVLLPATLSMLSDGLRLASIRVLTGPLDNSIQLLALGRQPSQMPAPRWSPESSTAHAGQLVRLPLRRATRTLGHLEAVPSTDLDEAAMATLRQSADLLAGAFYNADIYEREQESVRSLRELDELKDDFLSTVSHELRTPLSVLVGSVTLLTDGWSRLSDERRHATVAQMQPHVASLMQLVNDLLDFISERRTTSAVQETIDLSGHVRKLGEQLRPLCHRQELRIHADGQLGAWTDGRALERIIGNLIANAAKYAPANTAIDLTVESGDDAWVSVSDHGPGICPEDREHIFERFYRGNSDVARTTRGSGIGLAVTLAWVRAVGARVDITTAVGQGTTVEVHFPLSPDEPLDGAGSVAWHSSAAQPKELAR